MPSALLSYLVVRTLRGSVCELGSRDILYLRPASFLDVGYWLVLKEQSPEVLKELSLTSDSPRRYWSLKSGWLPSVEGEAWDAIKYEYLTLRFGANLPRSEGLEANLL